MSDAPKQGEASELREALFEFLAAEGWITRFDQELLAPARKLSRRGVQQLSHEWLPGENLVLKASVLENEQNFACEVVLWPERGIWQVESSCSCDQKFQCVHAAALLFSLPSSAAALSAFLQAEVAAQTDLSSLRKELDSSKPKVSSSPELPQPALSSSLPQSNEARELPLLELEPSFSLQVVEFDLSSRPAQKFWQTLAGQVPERWLVARALVHYGEDGESGQHSFAPLRLDEEAEVLLQDAESGETFLLQRAREAEEAALSRLRRMSGLSRLGSHPLWRRLHRGELPAEEWFAPLPGEQEPALFWAQFRREACPALERAGWQVDFPAEKGHQLLSADPADWEARLEAQPSGWFALSVGFEVRGKTHNLLPLLAQLLEENILQESLDRQNSDLIALPLPEAEAGEVLEIPLGRLRRILRQLFAVLRPSGRGSQLELEEQAPEGSIAVHPLDAAALSAQSELPLQAPESLAALQEALQNPEQQPEIAQPETLQASLRPYQLDGLAWMQFLRRFHLHGVLADDMGLGKTLQTIAHLLCEHEAGRHENLPSLVVAPTSVIPNWMAEARRFAPSLQLLDATGSRRHQVLPHLQYADLVFTSYALLHRDLKRLSAQEFHLVVLDEAQYIKNPISQTARAARQLHARQRLCLSGTPIENHLGELWSLFAFLQPGFLGSQDEFQLRFRKAIENQGDEERAELLRSRVSPLILRRHKSEVATELPPKTELIHGIELSPAQKDLYEGMRASMDKEVRQALAMKGSEDGQTRMLFLKALLKLRQVCCDPRLLDPPPGGLVPSAKLERLLALVEQLLEEGSSILIFSQFTKMLDLIGAELAKRKLGYLQLTGASKDRGKLVERFQSGEVPLFLISLKAGGTGLNLTKADTVIHYDPWWNPAVENQATDRAYRIGQTRPVFVHKLLCENSVEERIYKLQREKAELADTILAETAQPKLMNPQVIADLLAPLE